MTKRCVLSTLLALGLCGPAISQDKPVPAKEAPGKFTLPKGFSATLFAGEPDVVQPIAFTFDDRGRVWVVECLSYPKWTFDGKGADRVTMFEDTDGDGRFDKRQVIFDKGANLSGIELGHGGLWLCSSPNLVFVPCDFNADTPKIGEPKIILDGWNVKDTKHNIFNSLIWGPDGWLYGCNGIQAKANVGAPGTPANKRTELNAGVWRYHPVHKIFEAFAHGTTNPFGLDYNEAGEFFITNCVIKHLFHVAPGAHFDRMYGQDINPNSFALIPSIADYIHWAGGDWTSSRGNKPEHSDAGGGHAHSGAVVYLGDNFPPEYRGNLFTCNIHGNRLNQDKLVPYKSGYKAERAPDFLFANDPWFRGICVKTGPEGGLYVSDWSDTGECHNYVLVDATNGRLHRVVYGDPKVKPFDLSKLSDKELIDLQTHKNDWYPRHARRLLHERAVTKALDKTTESVIEDRMANTPAGYHALKYLWTYYQTTGQVFQSADWKDFDLLLGFARRLMMDNSLIQAANQLEASAVIPIDETLNIKPISTAWLRLNFASNIRLVPSKTRGSLAWTLLASLPESDWNDQNIPLVAWYAIEPLIGPDQDTTMKLLKVAKIPRHREFIARKATLTNHSYIKPLLEHAVKSDAVTQRDILTGIQDALGGSRELPAADGWKELSPTLLASKDPAVREKAMIIAVTFGDASAIDSMKKTVMNAGSPKDERIAALRILLRRQKPDLAPMLKELVKDKDLRAEAIRGLAAFASPETPKLLLGIYPELTEAEREDVVQTLAARSDWALALLDAVEAGKVNRRDVSPFIARQMQGLKDKKVGERLTAVWGQLLPASAKRVELTKKYKVELAPEKLKGADLGNGRAVFAKRCASCHQLYNEGGNIGPALTGAQRGNLDYILENVLDPSAVVPREYQVNVFELKSGRLVNGIIKTETDQALTIATTNEVLLIRKDEIDARTVSKVSMMPEGLFDQLTPKEVLDLVAYLQGREQVPLPPMK
ncbi:PVC-type heme-binding CxxCH protein [Zavarzinella formosa]|uniref:PVC-type heme-binding CxxCH protein n=1 Tax=Zavarzinella formosa TaxID=360055 RepID=UPI0002FF0480|nr:PVC-type heme-binding CxxCH protein [Zavarzinella formosa]